MIIGQYLLENAPWRGELPDDFCRHNGANHKTIQRRLNNPDFISHISCEMWHKILSMRKNSCGHPVDPLICVPSPSKFLIYIRSYQNSYATMADNCGVAKGDAPK